MPHQTEAERTGQQQSHEQRYSEEPKHEVHLEGTAGSLERMIWWFS